MDQFAKVVGRAYKLFDYVGAPDAERVIVLMGPVARRRTKRWIPPQKGEKVGVLKCGCIGLLTRASRRGIAGWRESIAVLDRTKEPGATGEPLYQDAVTRWRKD